MCALHDLVPPTVWNASCVCVCVCVCVCTNAVDAYATIKLA